MAFIITCPKCDSKNCTSMANTILEVDIECRDCGYQEIDV